MNTQATAVSVRSQPAATRLMFQIKVLLFRGKPIIVFLPAGMWINIAAKARGRKLRDDLSHDI